MNESFYISINPIIFKIGQFSLSWYTLFIFLGMVTAACWIVWQNHKRHAFSSKTLLIAVLIGATSGIIFAKLFHVFDFWGYFIQNPGQILSADGWAIWGGILGVALSVWIYSLISKKLRFALLVDMMAPGIILAQAVGRIGCTINGCCYGIVSYSPLSVIYTSPNSYAPVGIPTLPVVTFELFYNLIVFGILLSLRGRFKKEGTLFLIYLALYAAWRFGSDFLRYGTDFFQNIHVFSNVPFLSTLHEAQVVSLIILLVTIPLIFYKNGWVKKETSERDEVAGPVSGQQIPN